MHTVCDDQSDSALEDLLCAGVCSLRGSSTGVAQVARYTLLYYAVTTVISVLLGIILVVAVQPGRGEPLEASSAQGCLEGQVKSFSLDFVL